MLEITHKQIAPGTEVIHLAGKVMMGPSSEPIVTLVEELLQQGTRIVIFDFSGVTSLDSTGIGRFILSFNRIGAAGGQMRMTGAKGHIFDAFHISQLDTVFPFFENAEAAAKA